MLKLRDEALDWRVVDDGVVALDGERSMFLGTNRAGALLWRLLGEGTTRTDLIEALRSVYVVDVDIAARDVDAFLAAAGERDLLAPGS